tara:strand:- start:376 stop:936 length:561 start_codon:yes stop_codon:yes gene_type:complete
MKAILPQTYLIGLIVLLLIIAILVGRQLIRVRRDEMNLIKLEKKGADSSRDSYELFELASVQLRKRLYPQATSNLKTALKNLGEEPSEAKALIENALGFALAAQDKFGLATKHYENALKAKSDYPVALNNLGFANQKLKKDQEAMEVYEKVLKIDPRNKTAIKQLKRIKLKGVGTIKEESSTGTGF